MKKELYNYQYNNHYSLQKINIYAYSFFATQILARPEEFVIDLDRIIANISNSVEYRDEDLDQLHEKNHFNYYKLDTKFLDEVEDRYKRYAKLILDDYNRIRPLRLLTENKASALEHYKLIEILDRKINLLKEKVRKDLLVILDYVDKDEKEIDLCFLEDDNHSAKILTQKYNTILLQKQVLHLENINLEMERQRNRLSLIRQLIPLSKRYAEKRPEYLKAKYNKENTEQLRLNLSIILTEYIYLLSHQEFHDLRKVFQGMLDEDYSYVYEFLYTYKIILDKVWKHCLTDVDHPKFNFCYLVSYSDLIFDTTKIKVMNRNNMTQYQDIGYICKYEGSLCEVFKISDDQLIDLKLPFNIDDSMKFKLLDEAKITVVGKYNKGNEKIEDDKYPVIDIS